MLGCSQKKTATSSPQIAAGSVNTGTANILPRVLILTTGVSEGDGEIAEGVSIAVEHFAGRGAFVWLETRDILLEPEKLKDYSIIIAQTSADYHDADRKYSLSYLSDKEMSALADWVKWGGVLISEENIGRNTLEDIDRISAGGELNSSNWPLSEVFGIKMREFDMAGFTLVDNGSGIWDGVIRDTIDEDEWALIPTEVISQNAVVSANWKNSSETYPCVIENRYGNGKAFFLGSTYMLHPSNEGGFSSIEQIKKLYDRALEGLPGQRRAGAENPAEVYLSPWPGGKSNAGCFTFDSYGGEKNFELVLEFLKREGIPAAFVIDSSSSPEMIEKLRRAGNHELVSGTSSGIDFTRASFAANSRAIIENEQRTGLRFSGIRFPHSSANYSGLCVAESRGYVYDMSIGVDHLRTYAGSSFPYNLIVSRDSSYRNTGLIELGQTSRNDADFYQIPDSLDDYTGELQREQAILFTSYLRDYFKHVAAENDGLMVFSGSPGRTGYSELTIQALNNLTGDMKKGNTWIARPDAVAEFRNKLKLLKVTAESSGNKMRLIISLPEGVTIEGLSFYSPRKPKNVEAGAGLSASEFSGRHYISLEAKDGDIIDFEF